MCEALHLSLLFLLRDNGEEKKEKGGNPPRDASHCFCLKEQKIDIERISRNFDKKPTPLHNKKGIGVPGPSKIFIYEKM